MKHLHKTGLALLALTLAVGVLKMPHLLQADPVPTSAGEKSTADLALQAIDADAAVSKFAIDQLRAVGPAGLDALLTANKTQIQMHRSGALVMAPGPADNAWPRITAALDAVAAQHDAYAAGLYWYTDIAAAQAAARASGKPILSLRLLGNLNDEYSCANSRFFRTVLYANAEVSKHLRDNFILHWQSVRPVPVITIDFGDGRKIRRTITGNSIHYVLTADGTVVDAIPGLYGPKAFLRELGEAEKEVPIIAAGSADERTTNLQEWHGDRVTRVSSAFDMDFDHLHSIEDVQFGKISKPRFVDVEIGTRITKPDFRYMQRAIDSLPGPTTGQADRLTLISTQQVHPSDFYIYTLDYFTGGVIPTDDFPPRIGPSFIHPFIPVTPVVLPDTEHVAVTTPASTTDADWSRIAALHADDAALGAGSHALMEAKTVDAVPAARRAMTKRIVEDPLVKTIANFQRSIAEDTVRNEYLYHLQIHRWLADPANANLARDVNALNKRVYAELFLTPDSDPWLGLVPADTYTGLDNSGVCHD